MSREDILTVGLRLFAIWLGLVSIQHAIGVYGWTGAGSDWADERWWLISVGLLPALVAVLLWYFPLTVVTRLLPRLREPHAAVSADSEVLLDVGMILLGLWWIVSGLVGLVQSGSTLALSARHGIPFADDSVSEMLASLVTLGCALVLILRGSGIVGAIRRFREAGYTPARAEKQQPEQDR
jgi:hypothetical protein